MCACLCPYSIPLFKYPHFRIVFLGPSMTLLFRDRPKSHFGLSETQVAPEISWLISFSLWGPQASHFAVRHLITCTCFDPEPQRIPAQSAVNGLNILRQERCRRLNMAIKKPIDHCCLYNMLSRNFGKMHMATWLFLITPQFA